MMNKYIIFFLFLLTIIANYFYGPLIYAKISGQADLYTIGKLCNSSRTECENTYFNKYLDRIKTLTNERRTFFSDIIIGNDQIGYKGNCPCPYDTDRGGNSCGGRSSYSKGGQISYCYDRDVSDAQVTIQRDFMVTLARNNLDNAVQNSLSIYHGYLTYVVVTLFYSILFYFFFRTNRGAIKNEK